MLDYDTEFMRAGGRKDGNVLVFVGRYNHDDEDEGLEVRQRFPQGGPCGDQWAVRICEGMPHYEEIMALARMVGKDPNYNADCPTWPSHDFDISQVWEMEILAWAAVEPEARDANY